MTLSARATAFVELPANQRFTLLNGFMNQLLIMAIWIISTPLYAQAQPDSAKLKADTERVVSSILGDQAKMTAYCEINRLSEQAGEVDQQIDSETSKALSQKVIELEKTLGPEYVALDNGLKDVDPNSPEAAEINLILESLDDTCPD
jgi:hypothetical protein